VDRGEMPIEPGDSWFSPKCMEVQPWRARPRKGTGRKPVWEVERWVGSGPVAGYQPQPNCECPDESGATSEAVGANLHRREGNNPDRRLRSLRGGSVVKVVGPRRQPGGWLRSSHP
jgi:hypothetical protein